MFDGSNVSCTKYTCVKYCNKGTYKFVYYKYEVTKVNFKVKLPPQKRLSDMVQNKFISVKDIILN